MENLNNLPPFYVGQKVIFIGISRHGFVKDNIYEVKAISPSFCSCGGYMVDVGISNPAPGIRCNICNSRIYSDILWEDAKEFKPLEEEKFPLIKLEKYVEELALCSN